MAHGGAREGAGRKPKPDVALLAGESEHPGPLSAADRACYGRILEALNAALPKDEKKRLEHLENEPLEVKRYRILVDVLFDLRSDIAARRLAFETLKYLYDKRDGKAIQPVDVDASLESNVTIHLGSLMPKEFREKPSAPARER